MTHSRRSRPSAALVLLMTLGTLAACKGGDGASSSTSYTPATSNGTTAPDTNGDSAPTTNAPQPGGGTAPTVPQAPTAPAPQGATLSWTAPTENTDGSALIDLAGFVIVYGESGTSLNQTVRIDNPSVDTYVFQDLPAGRHYFAIKAYAESGAESDLSTTVSKQTG